MALFVEVSSPDAFQKVKDEDQGSSPSKQSSSDLQERLAKFKEVSSPDAFQLQQQKDAEEGSSPPTQLNSDLKERLEKFKEVSSPDAFRQKRAEEEEFASFMDLVEDAPKVAIPGGDHQVSCLVFFTWYNFCYLSSLNSLLRLLLCAISRGWTSSNMHPRLTRSRGKCRRGPRRLKSRMILRLTIRRMEKRASTKDS